MKRICTLLIILFSFSFTKTIAQPSCIALGCAGNFGTISANTSGPDVNDPGLGCYGGFNYKQIYWQYFYAPISANFTQTYHQTSTGAPLNLNFIVFDMGKMAPTSFTCPVDASHWTQELCGLLDHGSADVGPGLNGDNLTTTAGHFYAIAVIVWDATDPGYTFTIGTPKLGGVDLAPSNCNVFPPTCIALGCAKNFGTINVNTSGPDVNDPALGCYGIYNYKQIYWQFFYAPSGNNFTQTYHQTSTGAPINLNFIAFDMGTAPPIHAGCPINASGWIPEVCGLIDRGSADVGPGLNGDNFTTLAGHYYAIAIILWDNTDPSYSFTIGNPQLGGADLTAANCVDVALPITLNSFTAKVNNCTVDLNWDGVPETQSDNFEVQYSTNGTSFQTIGTVPLDRLNSSYSFKHNDPAQGKIYYRLKTVTIDDNIDYSKTIALKLNCNKGDVFVYPNPVTDILNVNITNANSNATIANLFDANGKLIYSDKMISGTNTINMVKFPKGIYLLTLTNSDSQIKNIKIIK